MVYDTIGSGYGRTRRADPRLARRVRDALGPSASVVNVGAGVGAYEPRDRDVTAVEPSLRMLEQRSTDAAPAVRAFAESLPFADDAFDAGLATLTLHHWADLESGLRELRRVVRERVVILTWDPDHAGFWLTQDYFPDLLAHDASVFPSLDTIEDGLGPTEVSVVPIAHDCIDGFLGAYWRRPAMYVDPRVRAGMSTFSRLTDVEPRALRLAEDLVDGTWDERHGHLREQAEIDVGYRLLTCTVSSPRLCLP